MKNKVYCVGLSKTGTSSLCRALQYMGYHVGRRQQIFKHHFPELDLVEAVKSKNYQAILQITPLFDAFVDNPWPLLYKELAKSYPNSKFILTTREEKLWIRSAKKYFGSSYSDFRKLTYGVGNIEGNEDTYLKRYRHHNEEVKSFFKKDADRLLILPLEASNKWELLSNFLGKEVPAIDYPLVNRTTKRNKRITTKLTALTNPLYCEVFFTLIYARFLTLFNPFKSIAKKISHPLKRRNETLSLQEKLALVIKLSQICKSLSKKVPFRSKCFEQALCMHVLLKRRELASEIYFGAKTKENLLAAHAWLIYEGVTLSGDIGKEQFIELIVFSNN